MWGVTPDRDGLVLKLPGSDHTKGKKGGSSKKKKKGTKNRQKQQCLKLALSDGDTPHHHQHN